MPKIPTYNVRGRITADVPSTGTIPNTSVTENIFRVTKPITDFAINEYVQEKKLEADNKAYKILSDMYIDQKDASGNTIVKGLYTIQSETKKNGNPSDAALFHDTEVSNLFNYFKNNKFNELDNFTKKAVEKKFYSTAGILKTKALEGSRLEQITLSKDIDEDYIGKEVLVLKEVGPVYLDIYNQKVIDKINSNSNYDEGQKKILTKAYIEFGATNLAESMATLQPFAFKEAVESGKFDSLSLEKRIELSGIADENILQSKFQVLTGSLDLPPDAPPSFLSTAYDEIAKGTFGNNKELQKLYNSLSAPEKQKFQVYFNKKARLKRNDMEFSILTQNSIIQSEVAQESKEIINDIDEKKGILQERIETLFGKTPIIVEQFTELNEKVINTKGKSISSFNTNSKIIDLIVNDEINQVSDPFLLPGETGEGKSIVQRYDNGVSLQDLKFLSSIIDSQNKNPETYSEMKTFFEFINYYKMPIMGSPVLENIDPGLDERLNNFKYTMYQRYINGIQNEIPAKTLTDPLKKEFIGKDVLNFMPNANKIFKDMIDQIKKNESFDLKTDAKRLPGESSEDYLKRIGLKK
tara:strand:+ start:506 stop:2248 length:1743 start_codon:yes stop_codon:yes gene_type:complete